MLLRKQNLKLFLANLDAKQQRFTWAETLGHLEYLNAQGHIQMKNENNAVSFALNHMI